MPHLLKSLNLSLWLVLFLCSGAAFADSQRQIADDNAALQACVDQQSGDICSFTNADGETINGICGNNATGQLTCVPYQVD